MVVQLDQTFIAILSQVSRIKHFLYRIRRQCSHSKRHRKFWCIFEYSFNGSCVYIQCQTQIVEERLGQIGLVVRFRDLCDLQVRPIMSYIPPIHPCWWTGSHTLMAFESTWCWLSAGPVLESATRVAGDAFSGDCICGFVCQAQQFIFPDSTLGCSRLTLSGNAPRGYKAPDSPWDRFFERAGRGTSMTAETAVRITNRRMVRNWFRRELRQLGGALVFRLSLSLWNLAL